MEVAEEVEENDGEEIIDGDYQLNVEVDGLVKNTWIPSSFLPRLTAVEHSLFVADCPIDCLIATDDLVVTVRNENGLLIAFDVEVAVDGDDEQKIGLIAVAVDSVVTSGDSDEDCRNMDNCRCPSDGSRVLDCCDGCLFVSPDDPHRLGAHLSVRHFGHHSAGCVADHSSVAAADPFRPRVGCCDPVAAADGGGQLTGPNHESLGNDGPLLRSHDDHGHLPSLVLCARQLAACVPVVSGQGDDDHHRFLLIAVAKNRMLVVGEVVASMLLMVLFDCVRALKGTR